MASSPGQSGRQSSSAGTGQVAGGSPACREGDTVPARRHSADATAGLCCYSRERRDLLVDTFGTGTWGAMARTLLPSVDGAWRPTDGGIQSGESPLPAGTDKGHDEIKLPTPCFLWYKKQFNIHKQPVVVPVSIISKVGYCGSISLRG